MSCEPDRSTACAPRITWPSLVTRLPRGGYRMRSPYLLTCLSIECDNKTTDSEFSTRDAHHDLPLCSQWGECHVISRRVVSYRSIPDDFTTGCVESDDLCIEGSGKDLIPIQRDTPIRVVVCDRVFSELVLVQPNQIPSPSINCNHLIPWCCHKHDPVIHDRHCLVPAVYTC